MPSVTFMTPLHWDWPSTSSPNKAVDVFIEPGCGTLPVKLISPPGGSAKLLTTETCVGVSNIVAALPVVQLLWANVNNAWLALLLGATCTDARQASSVSAWQLLPEDMITFILQGPSACPASDTAAAVATSMLTNNFMLFRGLEQIERLMPDGCKHTLKRTFNEKKVVD